MGETLFVDERTWVLVLTGAGVSAESGIPTFRDAGGLWELHRVEDVASPEGFVADPARLWRFYSERRAAMSRSAPNEGHRALARLEERLDDRFLLATQNIDGLHAAAGSQRIVELHGNLYRTRCSVCDREPFADTEAYAAGTVPACGRCDARGDFGVLRPDIVWFGERLDPVRLARVESFAQRAAKERFVFLAVGTSGLVDPAASLVRAARTLGAETWLVNREHAANTEAFEHYVEGPSGIVLPRLVAG
jgi:NAD-dependent deacetylase